VRLLMSGAIPAIESKEGQVTVEVPEIMDHEIVAIDLA
jgi:hypothetical protein